MSKTVAQPLHLGDKLTIMFEDRQNKVSTETLEPTAVAEFAPVYVNSNYACQIAIDTLDITKLLENGLELKLKVSSQNTPTISEHEDLALNNYINGEAKYTKFDFENLPAIPSQEVWLALEENEGKTEDDYLAWRALEERRFAFSLNISIPAEPDPNPNKKVSYGLIAIYYIKDAAETDTNGAYIKAKDGNAEISGLEFFNVGDTADSEKTLGDGLNIIKVSSDVKQLEVYTDEAKKSTVVFGNLDIVTDINPKLDYRITDDQAEEGAAKTKLDQLLKDIRNSDVAKDFYYNVPIQRSNEIDLNPAIAEDKLSSPLSWYDPNNVNRKFVISEIDADYLSTGITITKASRA
jgi:hypothetical protein